MVLTCNLKIIYYFIIIINNINIESNHKYFGAMSHFQTANALSRTAKCHFVIVDTEPQGTVIIITTSAQLRTLVLHVFNYTIIMLGKSH